MFFGLMTALHFQMMMDDFFKELIDKGVGHLMTTSIFSSQTGKWHLGFTSKGLNSAERTMKSMTRNSYWIQVSKNGTHPGGTNHTIEILNDHRNLTYSECPRT